jgi:thymidylate synthase
MNIQERKYLDLMQEIIDDGKEVIDRTGVGTKSIFGTQLKFSLQNDTLPLITTKKVFFRGVVEELLFFLRGETQTKILEEKGINIWKGNTSREFLDKKGLSYLEEGDLGKGYGFQWRSFGGSQENSIHGIDQIVNLIDGIKNDPSSRRHIVTAWNPQQLDEMALPPCHWSFQMYVRDGGLSCLWNQRSVDTFLGLTYNLCSYALLTHIIAKCCGLKAKEVIFNGGDTHLYLNHIDQAKLQISREPFDFPKINITKEINNINDIENLKFDDFELIGYKHHEAIKAPMAI